MGAEVILATEDLTREFAGFVAVNGVNLQVQRGEARLLRSSGLPAQLLEALGNLAQHVLDGGVSEGGHQHPERLAGRYVQLVDLARL